MPYFVYWPNQYASTERFYAAPILSDQRLRSSSTKRSKYMSHVVSVPRHGKPILNPLVAGIVMAVEIQHFRFYRILGIRLVTEVTDEFAVILWRFFSIWWKERPRPLLSAYAQGASIKATSSKPSLTLRSVSGTSSTHGWVVKHCRERTADCVKYLVSANPGSSHNYVIARVVQALYMSPGSEVWCGHFTAHCSN